MNSTVLALIACALLVAVATVLALMAVELRQKLRDALDDYDDLARAHRRYKMTHPQRFEFPQKRDRAA